MNNVKVEAKEIKMVDPSGLIPNPKNNNKHPIEQIERLKKIIQRQGFRVPIEVSNRSGFIVCGHLRHEIAMQLGMEKVPVIYQDFENEALEYAHLTAENEIARWAELDKQALYEDLKELDLDDIEMLGIEDFEIPEVDVLDPQSDEDEVPEVENPITRRGDIWLLGNHRLMCGDSTMIDDVEKLMAGEKADMAYCDPPYGANIVNDSGKLEGSKPFGNIGNMRGEIVKAGKYEKIIGDETTETARDSFNICNSICKDLIFWGAQYYAEFLPPSSGWIVWDKETDGSLGDGELAYTNFKKAIRIFKHKWSGMIKASEHGQRRVHPTQKPIALAEWCFEKYGQPESVLDLFLGSGSTLMACENKNIKCYGMEMSDHYCDVIINRWQNYTGKKATLESTNQTYDELKMEREVADK